MIPANESLERLIDGNRRFLSDHPGESAIVSQAHRLDLAGGQAPHAVILGCADSRVPAEIVFDQSLGDLFVVRVAGNIVAESQLGSVEFAAEQLGTRLVVVLGHSACGAVQATVQTLREGASVASPFLRTITDRVGAAIAPLTETSELTGADLVAAAVRANIRAAVEHLRTKSETLRRLIRDEGLVIVGAEYDLESGRVDFLDLEPSA